MAAFLENSQTKNKPGAGGPEFELRGDYDGVWCSPAKLPTQAAKNVADKSFPIRARIADLTKVLRWHCGTVLPDDDAGREYLELMVDHLAHLPDGRHRTLKFAEVWAPWCPGDELWQLFEAAARTPRWWKADELGRALNLSQTHRQELGVTTIAPADMTAEDLRKLQRTRKAARERERRRQQREARQSPPAPTGEVSARGGVVLEALRLEARWLAVPELAAMTRLQFKDARGRVVAGSSMGKLLARALNELVASGLISERWDMTRTGLTARFVRAGAASRQRSDTAICHGDTVTIQ
jgi:hypothetical protein